MKFDKDMFELHKLVKALELSIKSHPALLTKYTFDEDGEIVQTYDASLMPEITVVVSRVMRKIDSGIW